MFNSSTDAEKAPDRIQTCHGINTQHIRTRGNFLNPIKGTYGKHAANIIVSERSLKSFPLSPLLVNTVGGSSRDIQAREIK